jgi:acetyltransferase-like isoleucine patch superfamily enzyme
VTFEDYTSFHDGFHTMGAFSFSETPNLEADVGRYCSIGPRLRVFGERHPIERVTSSAITYNFAPVLTSKPQFIRGHRQLMGNTYQPDGDGVAWKRQPILEHDVWIGQDVQAARGITIGTGAVVAAASVVTKSVPPYTIVGGNPAKPIRMRFPAEVAARLLNTEWWAYHPDMLWKFGYRNPEEFCDRFEAAAQRGDITRMQFRQLTWRDLVAEIGSLRESESMPGGEAGMRRLLTSHATVVFLSEQGQLRHGHTGDVPANVFLVTDAVGATLMCRQPDGELQPVGVPAAHATSTNDHSRDRFEVVDGPQSGFGLRRGGLFLCAEINGEITLSRPQLGSWENFRALEP